MDLIKVLSDKSLRAMIMGMARFRMDPEELPKIEAFLNALPEIAPVLPEIVAEFEDHLKATRPDLAAKIERLGLNGANKA